jgi:hypothetical protein
VNDCSIGFIPQKNWGKKKKHVHCQNKIKPNKHQTRKDKELQKEKRKKDCPNKTKPKSPKKN